VGFGRKSSGETALKKTRAARAYREKGRQRSSDRWIPFKIPERPIAVRSAEVAQRLSAGVKSSRDRNHPRVDRRRHRRIGNRSFTSLVFNDNENPEIAICDFAM
jgi:hypothetical protein